MTGRGLPLAESDTVREFAQAIIEIRNLIEHNSGVVNKLFKKRLPDLNVEIGSRIRLSSTNVDTYRQLLATMAADVDQRAIQKFGLSIL
jgi:abortive infection bacteriophage resistance protein